MYKQSAAPLALCVFFLAACGGSGSELESAPPTPPDVEAPPPSDPPPTTTDFSIEMSAPAPSEASRPTSGSDRDTLAMIYENLPWSRIIRASDGNGGTVALSLADDGNGDADLFYFDSETGLFSLLEPQDYERPADADTDNYFDLKLVAHELQGAPSIPFKIGIADRAEIFDLHPVVALTGETEFGGLGRNLIPLGDIDEDGRPDIAVAAPGRHTRDIYLSLPPEDYHPSGDLYFVSGKALSETTLLDFEKAVDAGVWKVHGEGSALNLGYNMTLLGDLDGDGTDDFVVARDERAIQVISGATLVGKMKSGSDERLSETDYGTISLEGDAHDHVLSPRSFASLGDLDNDGLPELAFCATEHIPGRAIYANVFIVSGEAVQEVLTAGGISQISGLLDTQKAAYAVYRGSHQTCGPLTALGDVDDDQLTDIAIPVPGPDSADSGILVYAGAQLLTMLQAGGRHEGSGSSNRYVQFTDGAPSGTEQDHMVTPLGDVTGDGVDDFAFSWSRYTGVNHSAFIVRGHRDLLAGIGGTSDLRALTQNGGAIQLAASPEGLEPTESRQEPIHALRAPEDGLHETRIFVGAGESTRPFFKNYSFSASELPVGGTAILDLPIAGNGTLDITRDYGRQLSYVTSVGDLNSDGYGDLAIGNSISASLGGVQDSGMVVLVSGKYLLEGLDRGELLRPSRNIILP